MPLPSAPGTPRTPDRPVGVRWGAALALLGAVAACSPPSPEAASEPPRRFDYPVQRTAACGRRENAKALPQGPDARVVDPRFSYRVRTPANYDPGFAHPLLVVYAAATANAERSERFTGLTAPATGRGFIVAYVDHRPMSKPGVLALGGVAQSVAERWCIDLQQVFHTGHSDGGTVSAALALLPQTRDRVAAVAVSAAGFQRRDLEELGCRAPIPVMVMHGRDDTLFPGWGREAAAWWAACNGCSAPAAVPDADGCIAWSGCAANAPVLYCEGSQTHTEWPKLQGRMLDFLAVSRSLRDHSP